MSSLPLYAPRPYSSSPASILKIHESFANTIVKQPEERPLRVKRSRKSNINLEGGEDESAAQENAPDHADRESGSLPRLAPAPSQQDLTSSFRVQTGSNGSPHEGDNTPSQDNRDGQPEQSQTEGNEGTTPMDMDTKEPKVEASG